MDMLGKLQAEPMGFVLSPMKYEIFHIPTVSARFEIRINCDWCGILQTIIQDSNNYDSSGLLLNIDKVRENFVGAVYNASGHNKIMLLVVLTIQDRFQHNGNISLKLYYTMTAGAVPGN